MLSFDINKCGFGVISGGIMFICNFMKVGQIVIILTKSYCGCESVNEACHHCR